MRNKHNGERAVFPGCSHHASRCLLTMKKVCVHSQDTYFTGLLAVHEEQEGFLPLLSDHGHKEVDREACDCGLGSEIGRRKSLPHHPLCAEHGLAALSPSSNLYMSDATVCYAIYESLNLSNTKHVRVREVLLPCLHLAV